MTPCIERLTLANYLQELKSTFVKRNRCTVVVWKNTGKRTWINVHTKNLDHRGSVLEGSLCHWLGWQGINQWQTGLRKPSWGGQRSHLSQDQKILPHNDDTDLFRLGIVLKFKPSATCRKCGKRQVLLMLTLPGTGCPPQSAVPLFYSQCPSSPALLEGSPPPLSPWFVVILIVWKNKLLSRWI